MNSVLIIEDEEAIAFGLSITLQKRGFHCTTAENAATALLLFKERHYDLVLLDLGLPDADGLDVLAKMLEQETVCPVIVFTGRDDAQSAVRALRLGAADYLIKPTPSEELLYVLNRELERVVLRKELEAMRRKEVNHLSVIGESPAWKQTLREIEAAARAPKTPVLFTGESGTGKEMAASLLRTWSSRASSPFVTLNAACFPPALLESELFGHEAGAFTDARSAKRGLFELASGGILFLDEVAELPKDLQAKLLRILEGHPFRRVGGLREIHTNVRILSATNKSLYDEVKAGRFRDDLYHRLRVIEIQMPPLRERRMDIPRLALHFLSKLSLEMDKQIVSISPEALERLGTYKWTGNVRELRNVMERSLILAQSNIITVQDLPPEISGVDKFAQKSTANGSGTPESEFDLEAIIRQHIIHVYQKQNENLTRTAAILKMSRVALRNRLKEYGMKPVI